MITVNKTFYSIKKTAENRDSILKISKNQKNCMAFEKHNIYKSLFTLTWSCLPIFIHLIIYMAHGTVSAY